LLPPATPGIIIVPVGVELSVNVVTDPRQAESAIKFATGRLKISITLLVVFVQLLMFVTVSSTVWNPAIVKLWEGFGCDEVLLPPEPGSPKFHCHKDIGPAPLV
jgi:hypothetical protein